MTFGSPDHTARRSNASRPWLAETLVVLAILAFGYFVVLTDAGNLTAGGAQNVVSQPMPGAGL